MAEDREGFLGRWSRLKQARQADEAEPEAAEETESSSPPAPPGEATGEDIDETPDLPPIESLDKDSDFTVFMKEGVPEEIRHQALRKLWLTDPVLANLDGLLEYGEDFNEPWRVSGVVKTLYQVGKGMPGPVEEAAEEIAEEATEAVDTEPSPEAGADEQLAGEPQLDEPVEQDEPTDVEAEAQREESDSPKPSS